MIACCSSTAEGNEGNELRKRYLIPKADTSHDDLGKPESGGTSIPIPDCATIG